MFRLVFTHSNDEVVNFDCITEAMEYGDSRGVPCAIVSRDGILVKVLIGDTWITFH